MSGRVIATIAVGGQLEEAVEDAAANRIYVNVEDKNSIAVVDSRAHRLAETWSLKGCDGPTGLAFDARNHLLLSACEGRMIVTDSRSGKAVTLRTRTRRTSSRSCRRSRAQPSGRTMWLESSDAPSVRTSGEYADGR